MEQWEKLPRKVLGNHMLLWWIVFQYVIDCFGDNAQQV